MKKISLYIFRLAIIAGIFIALFKFIPFEKISHTLCSADKKFLFAGIAAYILCYILGIFRWHAILNVSGISIRYNEAAYALLSSYFVNMFFPSFIGGDVFRGFSVSRCHGQPVKIASTILLDRLIGAVALTIVAITAYLSTGSFLPQVQVRGVILLYSTAVALVCLIAFSNAVLMSITRWMRPQNVFRQKIESFCGHLYLVRHNPAGYILPLIYSIFIQLLVPASYYLCARALGVTASAGSFFILVPTIMVLAFLPITIAGAGTREAASVYYLSLIGIPAVCGLAISLISMMVTIAIGIIGGIVYVAVYHRWLQRGSLRC